MASEVRLIDAPVGLFLHGDILGLKTEYIAHWGVEAYVVASGETFWAGAKTAEERNNLLVTPVDPESLRPKGKWRLNKDGSGTCSECHRTRNDVWDMDNWDNFCSHCGADMREG